MSFNLDSKIVYFVIYLQNKMIFFSMSEYTNLSYVQSVKSIRDIRKSLGFSQRDMASRLNIGVSQYNKFETSSSYCNYEMLVRAAKILGKTAFISLG